MPRINRPKKPPADDDEYEYYFLEDSTLDGSGSELKNDDLLQARPGVFEDGKAHVCHFKDGATLVRYVRLTTRGSRNQTYYELTTSNPPSCEYVSERMIKGFDLIVRSFRGVPVAMLGRRAVGDEGRPDKEERKADKERRIAELRGRLDGLTDITDESERFRVKREIYDLERALDEDEWPDEIALHDVQKGGNPR